MVLVALGFGLTACGDDGSPLAGFRSAIPVHALDTDAYATDDGTTIDHGSESGGSFTGTMTGGTGGSGGTGGTGGIDAETGDALTGGIEGSTGESDDCPEWTGEDADADGADDACDNCPGIENPDQADFDDDGIGDACEDSDGDGAGDVLDNCPGDQNAGQEDGDGDGIGDVCDNCVDEANLGQEDFDDDGVGDACGDSDGDGTGDGADNCPEDANPDQADADGDGIGDTCDDDEDGDGVSDEGDNCPQTSNPDQDDADADGIGDACDDSDGDGVNDDADNCPEDANSTQADLDADGDGDVCDEDRDGDDLADSIDNCPEAANPDQADFNGNGVGNACDETNGTGSESEVLCLNRDLDVGGWDVRNPCPEYGGSPSAGACDCHNDGYLTDPPSTDPGSIEPGIGGGGGDPDDGGDNPALRGGWKPEEVTTIVRIPLDAKCGNVVPQTTKVFANLGGVGYGAEAYAADSATLTKVKNATTEVTIKAGADKKMEFSWLKGGGKYVDGTKKESISLHETKHTVKTNHHPLAKVGGDGRDIIGYYQVMVETLEGREELAGENLTYEGGVGGQVPVAFKKFVISINAEQTWEVTKLKDFVAKKKLLGQGCRMHPPHEFRSENKWPRAQVAPQVLADFIGDVTDKSQPEVESAFEWAKTVLEAGNFTLQSYLSGKLDTTGIAEVDLNPTLYAVCDWEAHTDRSIAYYKGIALNGEYDGTTNYGLQSGFEISKLIDKDWGWKQFDDFCTKPFPATKAPTDYGPQSLNEIAFSWYGEWCDSQLDAKFAWSDVSSLFEDESFHTTFFGTAGARKADKATASTRLGPNNQNNGWPRTCGMSNASDIIGGNGSYSLPQTSGASWGALLD